MTDEQQIRDLIQRWAVAVHDGDLATVLADHAPNIVMFDVPPPQRGVRGLAAYRDTWPGFFEWQTSGAVFEIESLDVTAGVDAAFACALLRCGTPAEFDSDPEHRLRLTIGLRKVDDRWVVTHEHHGTRVLAEFAWRGPNSHVFATAMPDHPLPTWGDQAGDGGADSRANRARE
jgi:uncharacterized protein (TIGR02246 family)